MHIPFPEYINLYNENPIYGIKGESICCSSVNTGLFDAIIENNITDWVAVGHDHSSDFYGNYKGINLAYGRKTGYGSYGPV